jgi:hypothetical protein
MPSLTKVIAALKREIDAALDENATLPCRVRLEAERVTLSLEVSVLDQHAPNGSAEIFFDVLDAGTAPQKGTTHRLTFEFKAVPHSPSQPAIVPAAQPGKRDTAQEKRPHLDPMEAEEALKSLSSVFGAPGFDSSARATVFREVFEQLSEPQAAALIASLSPGTVQDDDATLRNARHRINGVFRSGPLRSVERGSAILAEVLNRNALEPILRLIQEKWKTQQDWLDTSTD